MAAPAEVRRLVQTFADNRESYLSDAFNEADLRNQFLNPFFSALGWDIDNRQGYAEAYKDVVLEESMKIGGATRAPDYGFRVGGVRKFFVEAKKPAANVSMDVAPAFQLRRYAWSAKLPLSILTDFEEFAGCGRTRMTRPPRRGRCTSRTTSTTTAGKTSRPFSPARRC